MNKEDLMWKNIWDTLQDDKMKPLSQREIKIQDSDGGFFERFGSILYSQGENHDEKVKETASLPSPSIEAVVSSKLIQKSEATIESRFGLEDEGKDSGNESTEADSDSEEKKEENFKKIQNSLVGMNIEELYEEILYEILHNVGSDESKIDPEKMYNYMQEAFKIPEESHVELLEKAKFKEPPELRLNIEIIEAKDLNSKDPNGLADPFVTLYIASAPTTRYTSSVKSGTLNPKYEEHFSLPISENPNDDTLVVEVWDFDPAETIGEKMNKFFDVKGAKGFRKLMKEIAVTASSGKHDNEFVGSASVPLKTIPASGLTMWYNLDKKGKTRTQGTIKVRLNFSSEKNDQVASQEHRHLLKILLYNELELSKVAHYWWSGKFSQMAEIIITQHQAQSGLTDIDVAFAQWSVFTEVHQQHPLSFELFESILDVLIRPIQTKNVSHDEEISLFWEATKRLLPSCFGIIRKLRKKLAGDSNAMKHLIKALNIIAKISMLEPPDQFDLFPEQYYGWLKKSNSSTSWDIREAINQAVTIGTEEYYESIVDHNELNSDDNDVRLQQLIKIIQLVRSDLQRAIEHHDKVFQETMNYQYAGMLYKVYDKKLMEQVKPVVIDICNSKIERLDLLDRKDMKHNRYEEINMLTTLFELYLLLKRFAVLGTALCPGITEFEISDYYEWFTNGVAHWLDISLYKALTRIKKAIELDSLIAVDATVKYSSSAVDTLAIFYQIRIFWQQLAWPSAEGAFIFVSKIVDDICKCCTFYGDTMAERVDSLGMVETIYEKKFEVTSEWCLAINNIDYIRQSIHSFVKEMGVDDIIRNMSDFRGPLDAQRCSDTLQNVIENAIDIGKNKIYELTQKLARKMSPAMRRFLVEGAELFDQDSNSMDRLMMYMEDSLKTLHTELNDDNFMRMLDVIWDELASILYDLVHSSFEKRRPPAFYSNLRSTLQVMVENFKCQNDQQIQSTDKETLEKIDKLLEIHGFETSDLIHQYYKDRYTIQQNMSDTPFGILTVQCFFQGKTLEIEIMNAKHLLPMDTDGKCDPFVRIHFFPEEKFLSVGQPKTKVHQKTLFPLFDEKFTITLNDEQRKMNEAVILFSVKDHDYFGYANQYVAEAFLMFKDIADITGESGSIKQLHLTLTRPQNDDMETVKALQYRVGDKLAKEFLKKLKTKISDTQAK
ncbi:unnamed protein product [Chironomus riparius]|uniref:Munc13-4 n=1 Tax=Chironomus riparius TaxID=315576 RepID=A0A9P0INJ8_9DIPT|nr:unnamed protein product [Chironomus riparius]